MKTIFGIGLIGGNKMADELPTYDRGTSGRGVVDSTPTQTPIVDRIIDFGNRAGGYAARGSGASVTDSPITDRASGWIGGSSLLGRSSGTVQQTPTASTPNTEPTDSNGWPIYFADILGGISGERSSDVPIAVIEGSGGSSISPVLIILGLVGVGVAIYYFNRKGV